MNRLWVRLWLGIMSAFVGLAVSFEVAEVAVALAGTFFGACAKTKPPRSSGATWSAFSSAPCSPS